MKDALFSDQPFELNLLEQESVQVEPRVRRAFELFAQTRTDAYFSQIDPESLQSSVDIAIFCTSQPFEVVQKYAREIESRIGELNKLDKKYQCVTPFWIKETCDQLYSRVKELAKDDPILSDQNPDDLAKIAVREQLASQLQFLWLIINRSEGKSEADLRKPTFICSADFCKQAVACFSKYFDFDSLDLNTNLIKGWGFNDFTYDFVQGTLTVGALNGNPTVVEI